MNIDPSEILTRLGPNSPILPGLGVFYNYILYIIFFFSLIALFAMPDKNIFPTIMVAIVLMATVINKVDAISDHCSFIRYILNVSMLVLPLITAGTIRSRQSKAKAVIPCVVAALFGGVYFFTFWFFVQNFCATIRPG